MASLVAARAQRAPPFQLKPIKRSTDYPTVRIFHTFDASTTQGTTNMVTRKVDTFYCEDASDKEHFIRTIHEYIDACGANRLNAMDADHWELFRQCMGGDLRITLDEVRNSITSATGYTTTTASFRSDLVPQFVARFIPTNSFLTQKEYMQAQIKPYNMDVFTMSNRFRLINELSAYLPGSGNNKMFPDAFDQKLAFFRLMLEDWQLAFANSGNLLENNAYSYNELVQYMANQEAFYNAKNQRKRRNQQVQDYPYSRPHNGPYSDYQVQRPYNYQYPGCYGSPYASRGPYGRGSGGPSSNPGRGYVPRYSSYGPPRNNGPGRGFNPGRGTTRATQMPQ